MNSDFKQRDKERALALLRAMLSVQNNTNQVYVTTIQFPRTSRA